MLNRRIQPSDAVTVKWTNSTGSDVASGAIVDLGSCIGLALANIANGSAGTLATVGGYEFTKNTGIAFVAGEYVYWDSANSRCVKSGDVAGSKCLGVAYQSAASAETKMVVMLNERCQPATLHAVVSSGQAAAGGGNGQVDLAVPAWVTVRNAMAQVRSSAGALITNYTVTVPAAGTLRITGGGSGAVPQNAVCIVAIVP